MTVTLGFTKNLAQHVECGDAELDGVHTVREALTAYFESNEPMRSYLLDDRGAVRHHVVIFLNGTPISDRTAQSDTVRDGDEILVMQALSGG